MKSITAKKLGELVGEVKIIDVREGREYRAGHPRTARNHPVRQITTKFDQILNKEETYYISCLSGGRSARVCSVLKKEGYNIVNVKGGYMAFAKAWPDKIEKSV